ncbi:hypothetical protein EGI22_17515 [Lacihabitans sp. LS3-19]|uniref:hypothetical protein n=1 Tax=Lacihabitans sp. LS3-19 TaxID=2487335 RepID=UPI0020CC6975|nr:hypothetical protein [Lacihabitans sp. LS3-19]MCP9769705.1 hypothetical protein [Lacihabitans sp. LS3-19]
MKLATFLILIINVWVANAQDLNQTVAFANKLYEEKSYQNAMEAYKRALYFDAESNFATQIYPKVADCLYNIQDYRQATEYYELAYFSTEDQALKNQYLLKKISCFLIIQDYDYAEIEMLNLPEVLTDEESKEKIFYEAMLRFAKGEFPESKSAFSQIIEDSTIVNELFKKNDKISKISPRKAKILSIIMPGLGQLYVGDVKNGLNSFVLTTGLIALGLRSAILVSPLDAGISILPWFQRYYQGGYKKAEIIAVAKIQEKRYKVFNKLLDEVEKKQ